MERLISSSLLSSRNTPLRPRLLLPPRTSSSRISCRIGFPLLPSGGGAKSGDVFFSDGTRLAALLPSSPSSRGGLVRCSDEAARAPDSADAFGEQSIGRTRFDSFRDKAASRGGLIMLAATILFLIRPMLVPAAAYSTMQSVVKAGGTLAKTELLSSAWAGFFTGCLHTLSGPDHLAALAPLSIGRTRMESAAVGALWGCGHDAGQVLFGLLFLVLKDRLHIEVLRTWGTRVVAVTLLVIGAMGIREAAEIPVPAPCAIVDNGNLEPATGKKKKEIGFATFATGIIHGLQPDALMMVLPALALPSRLAGAAFLGMFLVGTVVAMGSYTVFIGSCSEALKDRIPRITEKLTWASSLLAISMGLALIISQYFGFSLY